MSLHRLCPVGFSTQGSGVMCLDEHGTIWFQDCGWGYSGATVDESLHRLLEGRPNLTW